MWIIWIYPMSGLTEDHVASCSRKQSLLVHTFTGKFLALFIQTAVAKVEAPLRIPKSRVDSTKWRTREVIRFWQLDVEAFGKIVVVVNLAGMIHTTPSVFIPTKRRFNPILGNVSVADGLRADLGFHI